MNPERQETELDLHTVPFPEYVYYLAWRIKIALDDPDLPFEQLRDWLHDTLGFLRDEILDEHSTEARGERLYRQAVRDHRDTFHPEDIEMEEEHV